MSSLEELKDEVKDLAEEFATGIGFASFQALKETAKVFKTMHLEQGCVDCLSPVEDSFENIELKDSADNIKYDNNLVAVSLKNNRKSFRKSRKSVCVLPKFLSSSESSDDSETESGGEEVDDNIDDYISDNSPVVLNKRRPVKQQIISSDEDDENYNGTGNLISNISRLSLKTNDQKNKEAFVMESGNETENDDNTSNVVAESSEDEHDDNIFSQGAFGETKKKIVYSSSDDESDSDNRKENYSNDIVISDSVEEGNPLNMSDSVEEGGTPLNMNRKHSPARNVSISDEGDDSESDVVITKSNIDQKPSVTFLSSDEDNFDNYIGSVKRNMSSDDSESDNNDFIDDADNVYTAKTPKTSVKTKNVLSAVKFDNFATPRTANKNVLSKIKTPKSVAGTPAYKREFNKSREEMVKELFVLFNSTIFDNKLPADFQITWNKRMTKTAGFCYYSLSQGERKSRVELSDKVIDCVERVRDTLIHELCHAATWIIDGMKAGHGPAWKYWAKKANKIHPDLPVIGRCHQYEIHTKFNYQCNGCGEMFGRHSKSIDATRHRCSKCGGIPELVQSKNNPSAVTPRTPNAYALFVKENFASLKKGNPGLTHKEIMQKISQEFKLFKLSKENKENKV